MKRIIMIMILLVLAMSVFAQLTQDQSSVSDFALAQDNPEVTVQMEDTVQTPISIIEDGVAKLLAALLSALIGWLCILISKYLKIKIMSGQVIGYITRKTEDLDPIKRTNDEKRSLAVEYIKKDKKISKWAKILYGGLEEAVSVVYKTVVKKAVKSLS